MPAALCHDFDRHAAFIHIRLSVKIVQRSTFRRDQRRIKGLILFPIHRAVQVVLFAAAFIARGIERRAEIDALRRDDRSGGVKKAEPAAAEQIDLFRQRAVGQRACGDHGKAVLRKSGDLLPADCNQRMRQDLFRDRFRKTFPVNGKCAACRYSRYIGRLHHKRIEYSHFLFKQTAGIFYSVGF